MWRGRESFCVRVSGNGKTGMKQDRIFLSLSCLCLPRLQIQCPGVPTQGKCGEKNQQIIKNHGYFKSPYLGNKFRAKIRTFHRKKKTAKLRSV